MIDPVELRIQVRTILATRGEDETVPEPMILLALERLFGRGKVSADEMMKALRWNQARGWAETRHNADYERDEWKLTERGRVKEGL